MSYGAGCDGALMPYAGAPLQAYSQTNEGFAKHIRVSLLLLSHPLGCRRERLVDVKNRP